VPSESPTKSSIVVNESDFQEAKEYNEMWEKYDLLAK
jgi:Na+-transporting NADH:ubiquinone oxidoreductase subunit NqrF